MQKSKNRKTGKTMRFTVVIEGSKATGFSAFPLELERVYATGRTESETRKNVKSGIAFHLRQLAKTGEPPKFNFDDEIKTYEVDVAI